MCGKANLPAFEHEHDAVGRLLEVGDHGLAPLEQRLRIQPLEGAQLREAVFADRPARVEEPPPPPLLDLLGVGACSARTSTKPSSPLPTRLLAWRASSSSDASSAALAASSQVCCEIPIVRCSECVSDVVASCSQPRGR